MQFAEAGCLITYGASNVALYRRASSYVDKVLKGAKPADLPVEQPTTFKLDVHFISSLPVMQRSACKAWADKRHVQIVWAVR